MSRLFYKAPIELDSSTDIEILRYALGAFLYIPATQLEMIIKALSGRYRDVKPLAICLEDAIGETGEEQAIENVKIILNRLSTRCQETSENEIINKSRFPVVFLRIRDLEQLNLMKDAIRKNSAVISGILIPKASSEKIEEFIKTLDSWGLTKMYVMPIIESKEFIYREIKNTAFSELYNTLLKYRDRVLGVRVGLVDILGAFGIRRNEKFTIYENNICSSFIGDITTLLNRPELGLPVSGGVSEVFDMKDEALRMNYIKEIELDKYHGLVGKTVIHPNQVQFVQAMYSVKYEDYLDAVEILKNQGGDYGVSKSTSGQKMNEMSPLMRWAEKTIKLGKIYGVLNEGVSNEELFEL